MERKEIARSLERKIEEWGEAFRNSYLISPQEGDMARWILAGIERKIIPDNPLSKENLAVKMGMIFAFVYKEDGSESFMEDLNLDEISHKTNMPQTEIVQMTKFMAEIGIIKSNAIIKRNNSI